MTFRVLQHRTPSPVGVVRWGNDGTEVPNSVQHGLDRCHTKSKSSVFGARLPRFARIDLEHRPICLRIAGQRTYVGKRQNCQIVIVVNLSTELRHACRSRLCNKKDLIGAVSVRTV